MSSSGSSWLDAVVTAPHNAYSFFEHSDNPAGKFVFSLISSEPAHAFWAKLSELFGKYSHVIIPLLGVMFQLYMSSKARAWAERRQTRDDQARAARAQTDAIWAQEQRRAEQASKGTAPSTAAAPAPASGTSNAAKSPGSSGSSTKRKGKK